VVTPGSATRARSLRAWGWTYEQGGKCAPLLGSNDLPRALVQLQNNIVGPATFAKNTIRQRGGGGGMAQCTHPRPFGPFVHIQIDFIQMPKCCAFEFVLVAADLFTKWVEAYPCRKADAITVVKLLMKDFVCRFVIPCKISSNRGTHFTAEVVKELRQVLQIKQHLHCPYHPQSAGQ